MQRPSETTMSNPLKKYFRQPKLYIKLPSAGNFYPEGALEMTETGEFPVYAMTAKDELTLKTPDALMNGQGTVDVIQSCIPNIKNAWVMPSIDVDAALVAIRIATYGNTHDIDVNIPVINEYRTYEIDLRYPLSHLMNAVYEPRLKLSDEVIVHLRPLTYKETTANTAKTMEEQRIFAVVNNSEYTEEQKLEMFSESFRKLTMMTVNVVGQSIQAIETPDGIVEEPDFIKEFIESADSNYFTAISKHLEEQRNKFMVKPMTFGVAPEDRELGAPETVEVPIVLDASIFFN